MLAIVMFDQCIKVRVCVCTCVVEQVVEALLQLGVYGRVSSRFPVDVSSLALAVSAVFGALPIRTVLTSISARKHTHTHDYQAQDHTHTPTY